MNLLKVVSNTVKNVFTGLIPSVVNTTHNLVEAANIASEGVVVSSVIDAEKDMIELLNENPEVSAERVNDRLKSRGLNISVPVPAVAPIVINQPAANPVG